jgi:hypothetical protein
MLTYKCNLSALWMSGPDSAPVAPLDYVIALSVAARDAVANGRNIADTPNQNWCAGHIDIHNPTYSSGLFFRFHLTRNILRCPYKPT